MSKIISFQSLSSFFFYGCIASVLCPTFLAGEAGGSLELVSPDQPPALEQNVIKVPEELEYIRNLMDVTASNLETQKQLLLLLNHFSDQQSLYAIDLDNQTRMLAMIRSATDLLAFADERHLTHLFRETFLRELQFYSEVSDRNQIVIP